MTRKKHEKSNKLGLYSAIFIIVIMVSSVIGFMYGDRNSDDTRKYGKTKFVATQEGWMTSVNEEKIIFQFLPESTSDLEMDGATRDRLLSANMVYMTSDFNDPFAQDIALAQYELADNMKKISNKYFIAGFTDSASKTIPAISCLNATVQIPVLYFKDGEKARLSVSGNCVIFEGGYETDFLRFVDKLLFENMGIDTTVEGLQKSK